jgi:hypothetical protein
MREVAMKKFIGVVIVALLVACQAHVQQAKGDDVSAKGTEKASVAAGAGQAKLLAGEWVRVAEHAAFSERDTASGVVFDGKIWVSNAFHAGNICVRDLWNSKDGVTWTQINDATPYTQYANLVVYKDKMWAIKGDVWTSTDGVKWTQVAKETPFGSRGYGTTLVHEGKIWQLGSGEDVWNTTDGVNWTCVTPHAAYGNRWATTVAVFGGKFWVMGGAVNKPNNPPEQGYKDFTTYNEVWCSSDGANWTRVVEHAPWAPRMWLASAVYDGRMWVIGGFDNVHHENFADAWYTDDGKTWHEFNSPTKFSPRHAPTIYIYQDSLWVVAGNSWPLMNDVWKLTLPGAVTAP